jgi:hypothetical protein
MATATYNLIAKNILGSNAASVTFSSIPATATDLLVITSARSIRVLRADNLIIRFNGSSATNYSVRWMEANDSSVSNFNESSQAQLLIGYSTGATATANTFNSCEIYIPNYAGSSAKSVFSTSVTESNSTTDAFINAFSGLWSLTNAITDIQIISQVDSFASGSSFFLYGITKT